MDKKVEALKVAAGTAVNAWKEWRLDDSQNFPSEAWLEAMSDLENALWVVRNKKPKCRDCGKVGEGVTFEPDPYQSELNGNETPIWLCEDCHNESRMSI